MIYRWCLCCSQNESSVTVYLEESYRVVLPCWRWMKVAFSKDLGFVEAFPDISSANNLSGFSSWSKLVWKSGQLKKKKKIWGAVSTCNKQKNHTAVLATCSFSWLACLHHCLPPPLPSPYLLIVITKLCAYDVMSTGLLFTSWVRSCSIYEWKSEVEVRNLNLYSLVQDYFQLCFLGLCVIFLFPLRNSFG